jgi:hypothetical protein
MSMKLHCDFCDNVINQTFSGWFILKKYSLFFMSIAKRKECTICEICLKKTLELWKENKK